ncbi:Epsin-3, clathrin recruitment and traffic between the Golgi and endosome [Tulasnella sp. 418]|nr:Epsin-3, clathrin recruitment and traffic between the Golgi and endosome [Tulasnella sp. 418]
MNVSEMEAKVREATNDDPWGASSTLMTEIAQGTFNFQQFNEIMPCIYARFMEKEAREWRQIYKALQLLEYIIKHGSERVVDDARSHVSTIKMLRNFHYIDEKGKDQGINVRNRSRELVELLNDLDRVRTERRKAKVNRNKYTGTGNDGLSFASASGSRYGGFGSDSLGGGGGGGGDYGYGGSDREYGGSSSGGFRDSNGRKDWEEYDAGGDEDTHKRSGSLSRANIGSTVTPRKATDPAPTRAAAKAPEPPKDVDLLGFGDESAAASIAAPSKPAAPTVATASLDDDFDDFQSAPISPPAATPAVTSPLVQAGAKPNVFAFLNASQGPITKQAPPYTAPAVAPVSTPPIQPTQSAFASFSQPKGATASKPNYMSSSFGPMSPTTVQPIQPMQTTTSQMRPVSSTPATAGAASANKSSGNFDDLWSLGLGSKTTTSTARTGTPTGNKSMKDLQAEKAQAAIWGNMGGQPKPLAGGSAFGTFTSNTNTNTGAASGTDDLLL